MVGLVFNLIYDEARKIWRYRWMLCAIAAPIFILAAIYIFSIPKTYESWAQLFVPKETPLSTAAEGVSLVGKGYGSPYVIQRTMLNDENLAKIVRQVNPEAANFDRSRMAAATSSLRSRISVKSDDDGFIEFSFRDSDPAQAQKVTQVVLNQFINDNVNRSRKDLSQASAFLDEQIASYEKLLVQSQAEVNAFRRAHPSVAVTTVDLGGGGGDNAAELASARVAYASAQAGGGTASRASAPQDDAIADLE